jgi:hypothetical protein
MGKHISWCSDWVYRNITSMLIRSVLSHWRNSMPLTYEEKQRVVNSITISGWLLDDFTIRETKNDHTYMWSLLRLDDTSPSIHLRYWLNLSTPPDMIHKIKGLSKGDEVVVEGSLYMYNKYGKVFISINMSDIT